MKRALFAVLAALFVAACATTPPNPLTADMRDGMFVRNVDVSWSDAEAKRDAKRMSNKEYADVQPRLQSAVAAAFRNSPSGSQPVDFKIVVTRYYPVSLLQADVSVVRVSDGKVLGVYTGVEGMHTESGGLLGAVVEAALKTDYLGIIDNSFAQTLKARFNGE